MIIRGVAGGKKREEKKAYKIVTGMLPRSHDYGSSQLTGHP
jgi:hypothetical protein